MYLYVIQCVYKERRTIYEYVNGIRKYKNQIKENEEIAKKLQNGNKPLAGTNTKDK